VRAHASVHPHLIGFAAEAAKVGCQGVAELLSAAGVNKRGNERNPERVGVPSWANRPWPHWKKIKDAGLQKIKNKKMSSAEGKAAETAAEVAAERRQQNRRWKQRKRQTKRTVEMAEVGLG
jgi:hypothetical protein